MGQFPALPSFWGTSRNLTLSLHSVLGQRGGRGFRRAHPSSPLPHPCSGLLTDRAALLPHRPRRHRRVHVAGAPGELAGLREQGLRTVCPFPTLQCGAGSLGLLRDNSGHFLFNFFCTQFFPICYLVTSHWHLEIGHGGRIYTTETGEHPSELLFS